VPRHDCQLLVLGAKLPVDSRFLQGRELAIRASPRALATTTATRNVAVGLVVSVGNFSNTPATIAVVAYGLVSILGALGCALLLGRLGVTEAEGAIDATPH
jgi:hypothetical protein